MTLRAWRTRSRSMGAVPSSVFYGDPATGDHLVRFAFCKRLDVLEEAATRLAGLGRVAPS